tara:strand:+ start:145 stop:2055 length:1911 start_codon:yes stop_codon:yes gene_type:complete
MSIICSISRGHNASTTLMVNGEIVFYIEEERLSRFKRDGCPMMGLLKVFEYVDHIDELVVCHTHRLGPQTDWTGEDLYKSLIRKISRRKFPFSVTYIDTIHHQMHGTCAFINSGFETAACVIADGAGSFLKAPTIAGDDGTLFEFETIFHAKDRDTVKLDTVYKHIGTDVSVGYQLIEDSTGWFATEYPGIVKAYEAITRYCGFNSIEAGKTMGLSPYGKPNPRLPDLIRDGFISRDVFRPNYPNGAYVICDRYDVFKEDLDEMYQQFDISKLGEDVKKDIEEKNNITRHDLVQHLVGPGYNHTQVQKDMAYLMQKVAETAIGDLIQKAHELTGEKNICISGGFGLNCVANYKFKQRFPNLNIFVEPISHDGGTSIGGAYFVYTKKYLNDPHGFRKTDKKLVPQSSLYCGPQYNSKDYMLMLKQVCGGDPRVKITDVSYDDVAQLIRDGNIVTIFQGRSEAGPRALGNRSILFDPTIKDGKDFVNSVKHREYFRPFACSVLADKVHDWFDLAGMDESPSMMYAVNCKEGVAEKIPSVIHVDGTCRIQTVTKEQNEHYYNLISAFEKLSDTPILFNTSFNLGGDPLVETIQDATETLAYSDMNYMYLPEIGKLVTMEFKEERPDFTFVQDEDRDAKV